MASIEELKRELAKERAKQNVLFNFKERELERMKLKRDIKMRVIFILFR